MSDLQRQVEAREWLGIIDWYKDYIRACNKVIYSTQSRRYLLLLDDGVMGFCFHLEDLNNAQIDIPDTILICVLLAHPPFAVGYQSFPVIPMFCSLKSEVILGDKYNCAHVCPCVSRSRFTYWRQQKHQNAGMSRQATLVITPALTFIAVLYRYFAVLLNLCC